MSYRHVVPYLYGRLLIQRVQHRPVLYVHTVAYGDGIHIAAQHGIESHAAFIAHRHIAHYGGIVGKEAILANLRGKSPDAFYQCHIIDL